jgi:hypothetical protein
LRLVPREIRDGLINEVAIWTPWQMFVWVLETLVYLLCLSYVSTSCNRECIKRSPDMDDPCKDARNMAITRHKVMGTGF